VTNRKSDLNDKEQALIDAALRELRARKTKSAQPQRAPAAPKMPQKAPAVADGRPPAAPPRKRTPSAPTTPIDHPTVEGWSHPAAIDAEPKVKLAVEEKWARIAAAMEVEQREARRAREQMRRTGRRFAIGATVVIILAVMIFLR